MTRLQRRENTACGHHGVCRFLLLLSLRARYHCCCSCHQIAGVAVFCCCRWLHLSPDIEPLRKTRRLKFVCTHPAPFNPPPPSRAMAFAPSWPTWGGGGAEGSKVARSPTSVVAQLRTSPSRSGHPGCVRACLISRVDSTRGASPVTDV